MYMYSVTVIQFHGSVEFGFVTFAIVAAAFGFFREIVKVSCSTQGADGLYTSSDLGILPRPGTMFVEELYTS